LGQLEIQSAIADQCITEGYDVNDITSNGFYKYFTEIGKQLADKIPTETKSFNDYMITNPNANSLYVLPLSPDKVLQITKDLKKVLAIMVLENIY
jgi:hypothetical protein